MPAFIKENLIAASEFRTLSQRELFHKLEEHGKLGILFKDHLSAVLLPHDRYKEMINRIVELERALEIGDVAKQYGSRNSSSVQSKQARSHAE